MKEEIKKRWVEALRSGAFVQTKRRLSKHGSYCCLGVLCEVVAVDIDLQIKQGGDGVKRYGKRGEASFLPVEVTTYAELDADCPVVTHDGETTFISLLNDSGELSFNEIADLIEAQL